MEGRGSISHAGFSLVDPALVAKSSILFGNVQWRSHQEKLKTHFDSLKAYEKIDFVNTILLLDDATDISIGE